MLCKLWGTPGFILKIATGFYSSMDTEYDFPEYESLQDEMALEMAAEALVEQYQMNDSNFADDEDYYDEDPYDDWAEVERREMVGIEAYSHWNEEAAQRWWLEEGRFG